VATLHSQGIQSTPDDMVANAWKVFHAATPYEHNRVLLEIVSDTWDVGGDFNPIG